MKTYIKLIILALTVFTFNACDQNYIDEISAVAPGADENAPEITISFPVEGTLIQVPELVASIDIKFEVTDDIEIGSISVKIDGNEIASYSSFKDYRRSVEELTFDQVTNGEHTLVVTATDLENKSSSKTVNFQKAPPYSPLYDGEVFFMPFDNEYMEMISFKNATEVGNPGFAGTSIISGDGVNAYKGTVDSYLTFPTEGLKSTEFSAAFWYYVDANPTRAGILSTGASADSRNQGFRLFREGSATEQRIKLNVGIGTGESWNDGDVIDATAGEWVHIAFTISDTKNSIFINGAEVRSSDMTGTLDWTGCENITIGAGGETFSYWNHLSDFSYIDELRFFDKALTAGEIQTIINNDKPYEPKYSGEVFYLPFEGNYMDWVTGESASQVGTTGFNAGKSGQAFAGATDSYITFPAERFKADEFSATLWVNINSTPDRAGIISVGASADSRNQGFRLFREGSATEQRIKLNVGTGAGESWNDGDVIDVTAGDWVHVAITISQTKNTIYFNGEEMRSSEMAGFDWTGCETLTIGAGGETFSYWNHLSDLSLFDEIRFFNKALTQAEVQAVYNDEK
ncbi:LamG-like jellyroll fold domain-containing protein [uncultured Draconibacterium sp.]|uniref:LamG-like jellyroll fold domain-containing protein n=1 Tax=uncultured Draconibacterium sp. TaxID=1573823 RepID=UPI0032167140